MFRKFLKAFAVLALACLLLLSCGAALADVSGGNEFTTSSLSVQELDKNQELQRNEKEIKEEAFAGSSVQRVVIPDGCFSIGERAFAGCTSLQEVHIPASVTSIAQNAFNGCPKLMIYAPAESFAMDFASFQGIPWANISSFPYP